MKTLRAFFISLIGLSLFYACTQDEDAMSPLLESETDLIEAILAAEKQSISFSELPSSTQVTITESYADSYLETAQKAKDLGFEVNLRTGLGANAGEQTQLFFDNMGNELEASQFRGKRRGKKKPKPCFKVVFPYAFTMPDGSSITLESREDRALVKAWYDANPGSEARPTFIFPIAITFEKDGEATVIEDQEALETVLATCKEERRERRRERRCFRVAFPHTVTLPDGSTITLESREDRSQIKDWYEANPDVKKRPTFVFPITLVYADSSELVINSQEELKAARETCAQERRQERHCFKIAFPHTVTLPNGSTITLESKEDKRLIRAWYEANPDVKERPALVFPVTLVYEDGSEVVANNTEEIKAAKDACAEDEN